MSELIFWVSGLYFDCMDLYVEYVDLYLCFLDLYFECLDLYLVSGLVFWVSELILRVSGSGRVGSDRAAGSAGSGGRVGCVQHLGKIHFGNLYLNKNQVVSQVIFLKGSLYMGRKSVHFSKRVLIIRS